MHFKSQGLSGGHVCALAAGSLPEANVGSAHRPGVRSCRRKKICSDSRKISPWQFSTCGLRPLGVQAAYRSPLHKRPQDTSSASLSPPLSAQRSFPRAGSRQCCKRDTEADPSDRCEARQRGLQSRAQCHPDQCCLCFGEVISMK